MHGERIFGVSRLNAQHRVVAAVASVLGNACFSAVQLFLLRLRFIPLNIRDLLKLPVLVVEEVGTPPWTRVSPEIS